MKNNPASKETLGLVCYPRRTSLHPKSEVLRNPVGPVCARYHQQPGWGCESWAQTDRSNHNGFC